MGCARDGSGGRAAGALVRRPALKPVTLGTTLAVLATAHIAVNAHLLRQPVPGNKAAARVSVLIPARDEAATIAACLAGVDAATEVLVLDDSSTDRTAAIAAAHGARVISGRPLPPGWLGKPYACAQLAAAATGEVLVFLDADVRLTPGAIDAAVALLESHGLDLISPHPRQEAETVSERLVQPLLQWSILTFLPVRLAERSSHPSLSAANGQFLVVRRDAYERAGGHVADSVLDDLALVRAVKRSGGRAALVDGTALASCRMYAGWPDLRDGYAKSLWAAFGSPAGAAAAVGTLVLAYVVPPVAALRGSRMGAVGYAAAVAGRVVTAHRTGGRVADALAHPLSVGLLAGLTAYSHVEHARGRLRWKGRPVT
jgi:cellulose synthase/poly-beta-1,6-N-acetylglucosamine synthase-like glycosyltransferase